MRGPSSWLGSMSHTTSAGSMPSKSRHCVAALGVLGFGFICVYVALSSVAQPGPSSLESAKLGEEPLLVTWQDLRGQSGRQTLQPDPSPDSPRVKLFSVVAVQEEVTMLKHWLDFYVNRMGIHPEDVMLGINVPNRKDVAEQLAIAEEYLRQFGVPRYLLWEGVYSSQSMYRVRQAIFGHYQAKGMLASTDWVVHADSDEFHGFPLSDEHPNIGSFLGSLNDVDVVAGVWRDRINSNGQLLPIEEDMDMFSAFPLACNFRTKQKIMAYRFSVPTTEGNHKVAPEVVKKVKFYPEQLNVHHFKWVDGVIPRLERRVKVKSTQGRETAAENVEAILDHLYTHDRGICVNCPKVAAGCTACNSKLTTAEGCDAVHKSLYQEFVRSSLKGVHSLKEAFQKGVAYIPDPKKLRVRL